MKQLTILEQLEKCDRLTMISRIKCRGLVLKSLLPPYMAVLEQGIIVYSQFLPEKQYKHAFSINYAICNCTYAEQLVNELKDLGVAIET